MRGPARYATYLGRILMALGFIFIVVAWDGAASLDYIQGQFPFLLSGAMPGLGLIIIGAGLEYVQAMRQFTARRAKQMAELNLAVVKLVGFVRDSGGQLPLANPAPAAPPAAPTTGAPAHAGAATQAAATAVATHERPADPDAKPVVAGRSSFHATSCHLVAGRDDMSVVSRLEAEGQGLSACRVCKP